MKKYLTPDFDVTVYEIKEEITNTIDGNDPDGWGTELSKTGDGGGTWWDE